MLTKNTVLHYFTLYIILFIKYSLNMDMFIGKLLEIVLNTSPQPFFPYFTSSPTIPHIQLPLYSLAELFNFFTLVFGVLKISTIYAVQ
jgi:hypothetical protein